MVLADTATMRHVSAIRKLIAEGNVREAEAALDNLLELGPSNVDALKLKAMIFGAEGRFRDEEQIWSHILKIDQEDPDAIGYIHKRHIEDREHYYFTDDLPGGGRRFLAYPRALVNISVVGLMGCIGFLMLTRLAERFPVLQVPTVVLVSFLILLISPWVGIIVSYCRSIRAIDVSHLGVGFATRFNSTQLKWPDVEKICLTYSNDPNEPDLRLVVIPRDPRIRPVEVDMNETSSPIRARSHLVNEISMHYGPVPHEPREALGLEARKPVVYQ